MSSPWRQQGAAYSGRASPLRHRAGGLAQVMSLDDAKQLRRHEKNVEPFVSRFSKMKEHRKVFWSRSDLANRGTITPVEPPLPATTFVFGQLVPPHRRCRTECSTADDTPSTIHRCSAPKVSGKTRWVTGHGSKTLVPSTQAGKYLSVPGVNLALGFSCPQCIVPLSFESHLRAELPECLCDALVLERVIQASDEKIVKAKARHAVLEVGVFRVVGRGQHFVACACGAPRL